MLKDLIKTLKVNHYIKNLIVFVPIIFSANYTNLDLLLKSFLMFLTFCAVSSSVYIVNDIIDINSDKLHPVKSLRPIPSGKIPLPSAIFTAIVLLLLSSVVSLILDLNSFIMVLSYFVLNIVYSLKFKYIPIVDVICIALGFIFRVVSGCFAIGVLPSPLVILLTFFVSLFFTFSKRKLEFKLVKDERRISIKNLSLETLNKYILVSAILSIAFYLTYVLDEPAMMRAGTQYLYITAIPFTLIVLRLIYLVDEGSENDDPICFIENDQNLQYMFLAYFLVLVVILSFGS